MQLPIVSFLYPSGSLVDVRIIEGFKKEVMWVI